MKLHLVYRRLAKARGGWPCKLETELRLSGDIDNVLPWLKTIREDMPVSGVCNVDRMRGVEQAIAYDYSNKTLTYYPGRLVYGPVLYRWDLATRQDREDLITALIRLLDRVQARVLDGWNGRGWAVSSSHPPRQTQIEPVMLAGSASRRYWLEDQ